MIKRRIFFYSTFFWTFILGMLVFAFAVNAATQSATFTTSTYPLLGNNHIAADFNGDGKLDLAGTGTNSAAIMLNNGDGTFQAKSDIRLVVKPKTWQRAILMATAIQIWS